jgi:hypothetical protein
MQERADRCGHLRSQTATQPRQIREKHAVNTWALPGQTQNEAQPQEHARKMHTYTRSRMGPLSRAHTHAPADRGTRSEAGNRWHPRWPRHSWARSPRLLPYYSVMPPHRLEASYQLPAGSAWYDMRGHCLVRRALYSTRGTQCL